MDGSGLRVVDVLDWPSDVSSWYDIRGLRTITVMRNAKGRVRIVDPPGRSFEENLFFIVKT